MSEDCYYGEIPPDHVPAESRKLAEEVFAFCVRQYGSGRPARLRWLKKSKVDFHYAKILEAIEQLGGKTPDRLEQGYSEGGDAVWGQVWARRLDAKKRSSSIFIVDETPLGEIARVVGHEFYHLTFSPPCFYAEQVEADEEEAARFGERIEREMTAEKKRESDEERGAGLRQIYWSRNR